MRIPLAAILAVILASFIIAGFREMRYLALRASIRECCRPGSRTPHRAMGLVILAD